jgi:hypothetical protein
MEKAVLWIRNGFNADSDPAIISMRIWIQGAKLMRIRILVRLVASHKKLSFYMKIYSNYTLHYGTGQRLKYRVAAIFPEHFQSFTVTLKNYNFEKFFFPNPSQLCAKA